MSFQRPPEPSNFQRSVGSARSAIAGIVASGVPPKSGDFTNRWADFREHLVAAQHRKCAYCEENVTGTAYGDVEHVRPKAGVQEQTADRTRWGVEQAGGEVKGRRPRHVSDWGYHWLAYAWDNYVLACQKCNQAWKKNLFPIAEGPRLLPPSPACRETPLLLNPFEGPDPIKHLRFNDKGEIAARDGSRHGEATIRTCGLDREHLRGLREPIARRVEGILIQLEVRESEDDTWSLLDSLWELGAPDQEHAGMVRSMYEVYFDRDWRDTFGDDPA